MPRRPARKARTPWLLPIAAGALQACAGFVDPPLPRGARDFVAPAVYTLWWSMTEACSGRRGALGAVEWYVVPGARLEAEGSSVGAYWSAGSNRVVLAEGQAMEGALVRHEMLHALLGAGAHSREAFLERCGGVVLCIESCLREAGPPRLSSKSLRRVTPGDLEIDTRIDPSEPGAARYNGQFMVTVTARNPGADSVVVVLPGTGGAGPAGSFSFDLSGRDQGLLYSDRAWDSGITLFAPGETKQQVYDFAVRQAFDERRGVPPGTYSVRGGFGSRWSAYRVVDVRP
jgi:hypothetical protein